MGFPIACHLGKQGCEDLGLDYTHELISLDAFDFCLNPKDDERLYMAMELVNGGELFVLLRAEKRREWLRLSSARCQAAKFYFNKPCNDKVLIFKWTPI